MPKTFLNVSFEDGGDVVDVAAVRAFEERIGARLPDAYRQFLIEVNGGRPRPSGFKRINEPAPAPGAQYYLSRDFLEGELARVTGWKLRKDLEQQVEFWHHVYHPSRVVELHYLNSGFGSLDFALRYTKGEEQCLPYNVIEIGRDLADCSICLAIKEPFLGSAFHLEPDIAILDMNEYPETFESGLVARSFEELLQSLFPARILVAEGYEPPAHLWMSLRPDMYDE